MTLAIDAIAEALAAKYASLTPPTGYTAIRSATSHPANAGPATPFLIVWTREGELITGGGYRDGETDFDVVLYLDRAQHDMPRESERLQKWIGVLLDATLSGYQLGLSASGVQKAMALSWDVDNERYANPTYDVIRIRVRVTTRENVTLSA